MLPSICYLAAKHDNLITNNELTWFVQTENKNIQIRIWMDQSSPEDQVLNISWIGNKRGDQYSFVLLIFIGVPFTSKHDHRDRLAAKIRLPLD